METKQVVVVTGLSGAGRSVAAGAFEDLGWFVIDNLPVSLVSKVSELAGSSSGYERVALVMHGYDEDMAVEVEQLRAELPAVRVVFLEASDEVIIRRYVSTKRRHPLEIDAGGGVAEAIVEERTRLGRAKAAADLVIDTSDLNPHQLRDTLTGHFATTEHPQMRLAVTSFGFKHGLPLDVDMVIDCRFLPNPHWDPELRPFSGRDEPVRTYVVDRDVTQRFLDRLTDLLVDLLPAYVNEGKSYFTIAFGCTGGRHRSVAVAEDIATRLGREGWTPRVSHRDIER